MLPKYAVTISPPARHDLLEILDNIAEVSGSLKSVAKWSDKILGAIDSLDYMPERFSTFGANPAYRSVNVGKYVIIYHVDKTIHQVIVARIVYTRRNMKRVSLDP